MTEDETPTEPTKGNEGSRDFGEQPLARKMAERGLRPTDLVAASGEQLTHRMVARAMKGRRLTPNTMNKVLRAWNAAAGASDRHGDLFTYDPRSPADH